MNKLLLAGFLLLSANFGFAQNNTYYLLIGEWYYPGSSLPEVNDTLCFTREKIYDSYLKWEYRENGSFYEQAITEVSGTNDTIPSLWIMNSNSSSVWIFKREMQIIELKDLKRMYKITEINNKNLNVVMLR